MSKQIFLKTKCTFFEESHQLRMVNDLKKFFQNTVPSKSKTGEQKKGNWIDTTCVFKLKKWITVFKYDLNF